MKKLPIKQILVVLLTIGVLVAFVFFDEDVRKIDDVLASMSPLWLLGALFCVLLYYLGDTGMYMVACSAMHIPQTFFEALITTMIGFFYSALTPLASGGQPFQVIQMKSRGINVGTATSVLMVKFLAWHITITLFGMVGFSLLWQDLASIGAGIIVMFCFGFLAHAVCAFTGIMLMFKPVLVRHAGLAVIAWTGRVFLKRHSDKIESWKSIWDRFINDYTQAVDFAKEHKNRMLVILGIGIIEVLSYLSVTYFVYRGLGFSEVGYWPLLLMQAMLSISVAFIPLPGASVASEGGFYALFTQFFNGSRLAGMLIWRALTYYLSIVLGLVAVLIDGFRKKRREENQHVSS
ncbi:MAG: lysylphosphatidylglycerol synthase transmembrane domain-containing protein [Clostridia bacterium]